MKYSPLDVIKHDGDIWLSRMDKKVIKRLMKLLNHFFFCCHPHSVLPSDREGIANN